MNQNIHTLERISIYILSIPVTIISLLVRRNKKRIIFNSFLNKKFNFNSKYLFLWFIQNMKHYNSYYIINDDVLRNKLNNTLGNYFIETKSLSGKIFVLKASIWFISTLDMPVGGYFLTFKRCIIHLGHGTPLKNIGLLEKNISLFKKIYYKIIKTNISYSIASSNYFAPIISKFINIPVNKILIAGQPRNDQLFIKTDFRLEDITKNKNKKNILYVPTWRPKTKLQYFVLQDFILNNFNDFLINKNINIFIRTHPNLEEEVDKELLNMPNIFLFSRSEYDEIMDYLNLFDLIITDYSSIHFDYLLLNRPIIFLPYDFESYNNEIGFTVPYHEFTPGYKPSSMNELINAINKSLFGEDHYIDERAKVNRLCNTYQKNNCEEFIMLLTKKGIIKNYNQ